MENELNIYLENNFFQEGSPQYYFWINLDDFSIHIDYETIDIGQFFCIQEYYPIIIWTLGFIILILCGLLFIKRKKLSI